MTNHLVYLVYGKPQYYLEAKFSILSAARFRDPGKVIVYTDNPAGIMLPGIDITFEPIDETLITQWKGPQNYVFRPKIMMLLDCMEKYEGNFIYVDGDTIFTESPRVLFDILGSASSLLHEKEGSIFGSHRVFRQLVGMLKQNDLLGPGRLIDNSSDLDMYNAGLIGITSAHRDLVKQVLAAVDTMSARFYTHVNEQFAFSYFLQKNTGLGTADSKVIHYWKYKDHFAALLKDFFEKYNGSDPDTIAGKVGELVQPGNFKENKNSFLTRMKRSAKKMLMRLKNRPAAAGRRP